MSQRNKPAKLKLHNRVIYTNKIKVQRCHFNSYLFVINATRLGILLLLYGVCDALKIALTHDFQSPSSSFAILKQNQNNKLMRMRQML